MTDREIAYFKNVISDTLGRFANVAPSQVLGILPTNRNSIQGKLYEASVLAEMCKELSQSEGLNLQLVNGSKIRLKQKGGPINRNYTHIDVFRGNVSIGEIWTDIYFSTLSHAQIGNNPNLKGNYHELDIVMVPQGCTGKPRFDQVMIAVECKNTKLEKHIIRELLGYRRELSFKWHQQPTGFQSYPTPSVPAHPPSIHMLFCRDRRLTEYQENCAFFGTILVHHEM